MAKEKARRKRARSRAFQHIYAILKDPTTGLSCLDVQSELDRLLKSSQEKARLARNIVILQARSGVIRIVKLAPLMGITQAHLSRILSGEGNFSLHVLINIAAHLNVKTTTNGLNRKTSVKDNKPTFLVHGGRHPNGVSVSFSLTDRHLFYDQHGPTG